MKLISMVAFVLEQDQKKNSKGIFHLISETENLLKIRNYANFLSRPLELGMFVPTDEKGNILKYPGLIPSHELEVFRKAKERVLFEGFFENGTGCAVFHQSPNAIVIDFKSTRMRTIEDLLSSKCEFTLTQSAINQITNP